MDELAVGFNFLEDGDRADQAPVLPGAVYLDTGGGRAGSKCPLRVARLMTRGPNDVADTAVRARRQVAAGADLVQIANEPNNSVEEWRPFNTNDETLVVEHAEWFERVCNAAPGVPILWTPPSPGIPGYEIWTNHRRSREAMTRAAGISWHVYGDLALMRETLDVVLPAADELGLDVYVTECNFGAGRTVDLGAWASVDLPAFLDHARRF